MPERLTYGQPRRGKFCEFHCHQRDPLAIGFPSYVQIKAGGIRTVFIDDYNNILEANHPQTGRESERAVRWTVLVVTMGVVTCNLKLRPSNSIIYTLST